MAGKAGKRKIGFLSQIDLSAAEKHIAGGKYPKSSLWVKDLGSTQNGDYSSILNPSPFLLKWFRMKLLIRLQKNFSKNCLTMSILIQLTCMSHLLQCSPTFPALCIGRGAREWLCMSGAQLHLRELWAHPPAPHTNGAMPACLLLKQMELNTWTHSPTTSTAQLWDWGRLTYYIYY